jgi:hypothetical protein
MGPVTAIFVMFELFIVGWMFLCVVGAFVVAPFYLLWLGGREVLALTRRYRDGPDPVAELQARYVGGELTVAEFEAQVAGALVAPRVRRRVSPFASVAVVDVCLALLLLLVAHSALARASGAVLGVAALVGPLPRRVAIYAFAAGVALLTAPLAALAFGASAAYRGFAARRA